MGHQSQRMPRGSLQALDNSCKANESEKSRMEFPEGLLLKMFGGKILKRVIVQKHMSRKRNSQVKSF